MEKIFDFANVKDMLSSGLTAAERWRDMARATTDAQTTAAQELAIQAVNRSFDLARELVKTADTACRTWTDHAAKCWPAQA